MMCSLFVGVHAGVLGGAGVVVFGVAHTQKYSMPNGWGFWMCVSSCACLVLRGAVSACWACRDLDLVYQSDPRHTALLDPVSQRPDIVPQVETKCSSASEHHSGSQPGHKNAKYIPPSPNSQVVVHSYSGSHMDFEKSFYRYQLPDNHVQPKQDY